MNKTQPPVTAILASFASSTTFEDVNPAARDRTREHIKDCIGVAVGACVEEPAQIIMTLASEYQNKSTTHIIGSGIATSPYEAAWVNGALAHLLDFDDTGFSHPSACILPAALALGELNDSSGKDLITAMAVGYEVFERLSRSGRKFESIARRNGLHPTSVYGCPAAAAAAGKLMGLNEEQMIAALGLSASAAGGITESFGTWGKGTQAGNAARAGVMSVLLASRNYRGSTTMLEGEHGMMSTFLGHDNYDFDLIDVDFYECWAIEKPGLSIKPFPACGAVQIGIAAALRAREQLVDDPNDISRIDITATEAILHTLHIDTPTVGFEGKFCLRYCVAVALVDGDVTLASFSEESFERPIVQSLIRATHIEVLAGFFEPSPEQRRLPITVTMKDGSTTTVQCDTYLGHVANPMSTEQISAKFIACVERLFPKDQAIRSNKLLDELESTSVRSIVESVIPVAS